MGFIGGIGKVFTKVLPKIIPVAAKVLAGPVGSAAMDIFKQVAGGVLNKSGTGGLFSDKIPLSLPNPLSRLNDLAAGIGGKFNNVGDFLKNIGGFLTGQRQVDGQSVTVPRLADRGAQVAQTAQSIAQQVAGGAYNPPSVGGTSGAGNVQRSGGIYDTGLNPAQREALAAAAADPQTSPSELKRMKLQFEMANHKELMEFISNMMKMQHDTAKSIISNIR